MHPLQTGQPCQRTASYAGSCGCGIRQRINAGQAFPPCPICERRVVWYERDMSMSARNARRSPSPRRRGE